MADFVVMPKTDYQNACDAVREKTGKSDLIRSGDMGAEIRSIPVGGGGDDDFIGIRYSNYSGDYLNIPRTADARSLDKQEVKSNRLLQNAFANYNTNPNGGYFAQLEEVYLPESLLALIGTFTNCTKLKTIHGSLSRITETETTFQNCTSLDISSVLARMTILAVIGNYTFRGCTQVTEITLPTTVTSIHSGAFNGCTGLTNVILPEGWNLTINLSWSTELTQESLHNMIENLANLTGQSVKVFQVGSTNVAKIDEEHIAMLNTKNWEYY